VVICVTANLQLTGWLTAMQLDVTGFALLLEHEGVPRRDFADRDWDRAEQPYPLRGTPDAPRQGAVDISNVEFVRASRWAARSNVKAC
jgi:hypothetical protein